MPSFFQRVIYRIKWNMRIHFLNVWNTIPLDKIFTEMYNLGASGKEPTCQCRRCKRRGLWYLCREDPLEEGMATHSSILAWRIPWTDEPGRLPSMGSQSQTQPKQLSMYIQSYLHMTINSCRNVNNKSTKFWSQYQCLPGHCTRTSYQNLWYCLKQWWQGFP